MLANALINLVGRVRHANGRKNGDNGDETNHWTVVFGE